VNRALAIASVLYVLSHGRIAYSGPVGDIAEDEIFALYAQQPAPAGGA
jgi:ABC-type branched-subunit amino acid transport system ATPase component